MIDKLKKQLNFELVECKFVKKDNLTFLDIEINVPTLKEIEIKTKIISNLLDEIDLTNNDYYLNVYSSGAEKEINISEIKEYIQKNIKILLINKHLNKLLFEGELIEVLDQSLKLKINFKGCFRKIEFQKNNIQKINQSIKLTKNKKDKINYE